MNRVFFAENAKNYDGSSDEVYHQYCLVGSFFGLKEIKNNNKVGITDDELNAIVEEYEESKSFEPIFSNYLKYKIRLKQSQHKNTHSESIKLLQIKNVSDCLEVTDNNLDIIKNVLENLRKTIENIRELKEAVYEEEEYEEIKDKISHDDEWEKICESPLCLTKKCCLEKKIKNLLKKKRVSLIRNGSRDYNFSVEIKHEKNIKYLISILNDAKNKIENEILEKEWVRDVGLVQSE